jgi:hypothetical protein
VQEQNARIAALRAEGYTLLNRELGDDCKKTTEAEQRLRVQAFVDNFLAAKKTAQISN